MTFACLKRLPTFGAALVALACGGDGGGTGPCSPGTAMQLVKGGDNQTWYFNNDLPTLLSVTARDASGCPVPGVDVNWAVASGGGSVNPMPSTTNASGVATTMYTLGPSGDQSVTATATTPGVPPQTFTANASAPPTFAEVSLSGSQFVADSVVVQVNTGTPGVGDVTWTWNDNPITHDVTFTGCPTPRPANSPDMQTGTYPATFTTVGTCNYVCTFHIGMRGKVVVVN
jgi:plastocyanin